MTHATTSAAPTHLRARSVRCNQDDSNRWTDLANDVLAGLVRELADGVGDLRALLVGEVPDAAKSTPPFEQSPPAKEGWRTPLQDWQQEEPPSVGHAERAVTHAIRGTLLKNDSIRRFFSAVELTTTCKSDCCWCCRCQSAHAHAGPMIRVRSVRQACPRSSRTTAPALNGGARV